MSIHDNYDIVKGGGAKFFGLTKGLPSTDGTAYLASGLHLILPSRIISFFVFNSSGLLVANEEARSFIVV